MPLEDIEGLNLQRNEIVKKGMQTGIRPSVKQVKTARVAEKYYGESSIAAEDIVRNKDVIGLTDLRGNPKLPESVEEMSKAVASSMENNFKTWEPLIEKMEQGGGLVPLSPAVRELRVVATDPVLVDKYPKVSQYAKDLADRLENRGFYKPSEAQRGPLLLRRLHELVSRPRGGE